MKRLLVSGIAALAFGSCIETVPVTIDYSGPGVDWPSYGGAAGGGHFSAAAQITPDNVHALAVAWQYRSGHMRQFGSATVELPGGYSGPAFGSAWQLTPLLVNDRLYGCTAFNKMFALDPTTGEEIWSFDPGVDIAKEAMVNCRGVSSWQDPQGGAEHCAQRIFMGTMDGRLLARDARTGTACEDFGEGGSVNLKAGLGEVHEAEYSVLSPGAVLGDKLIVGAMVLDRQHDDTPGGVVRAYDVRSGALRWFWDPIPPGRKPSREVAGKPQFRRGTTNVWSIISVDVERNLVFLPTGNTATDFYGAQRDELDYWSSAVVALDGDSGEVVWRFQMVHHDIWDYDTPSQPTLFEFSADGKTIPALAQPTKMGHLYLLNRETGEPLFPVEERPVPQQHAVAGEYLSPTQPFPTRPPPLHPAGLKPAEAWGLTPWDRGACRRKIEKLHHQGIFTPPSEQGSVFFPSDYGGHNWGAPAIDPKRNIAVLNSRNLAASLQLIPRDQCTEADRQYGPQMGTPWCVRIEPLVSPLGLPCNPPPWGTLTAVDLNRGEKLWQVPLGTLRKIAPWPVSLIRGAPNIGGPTVTASGLTFIASTTDQYLRAFDTQTGAELWKHKLPSGGHATPMTYRSRKDGRQYLVIAVGGHFGFAKFGQQPSDHLIAFSLRERR